MILTVAAFIFEFFDDDRIPSMDLTVASGGGAGGGGGMIFFRRRRR